MNRKTFAYLTVMALVIGVAVGGTLLTPAQALAGKSAPEMKTVKAEQCRVVGPDGQVLVKIQATPKGDAGLITVFGEDGSKLNIEARDFSEYEIPVGLEN